MYYTIHNIITEWLLLNYLEISAHKLGMSVKRNIRLARTKCYFNRSQFLQNIIIYLTKKITSAWSTIPFQELNGCIIPNLEKNCQLSDSTIFRMRLLQIFIYRFLQNNSYIKRLPRRNLGDIFNPP